MIDILAVIDSIPELLKFCGVRSKVRRLDLRYFDWLYPRKTEGDFLMLCRFSLWIETDFVYLSDIHIMHDSALCRRAKKRLETVAMLVESILKEHGMRVIITPEVQGECLMRIGVTDGKCLPLLIAKHNPLSKKWMEERKSPRKRGRTIRIV